MRLLHLTLFGFLYMLSITPVLAFECANAGAAPLTLPEDNGDGNSTACGGTANAFGGSVAIGLAATSSGSNSSALGPYTNASAALSLAAGYGAQSLANSSVALGANSDSLAERATAIGAFAFANQPDTVILGSIAGVNSSATYAKIGVGTSAPAEAVDVERSAAAARFQLTSFTSIASEAPQYIQRRARGTTAAPTAVQNNDNLGLFSFRGYNGSSMGGSRATITAQAAGAFSASSTPTRLIFATTPVGQTTPQSVLVITPDGKVQVKGVNLIVPDYVFEEDYKLMPLSELKSFIDENGHLPGVASAEQVKDEGLDLAGSQMDLLQKVEELTLYTLQQQELIQQQQKRIAHLETDRAHLRSQQDRIEVLEAQQERIAHLETQLKRTLADLD